MILLLHSAKAALLCNKTVTRIQSNKSDYIVDINLHNMLLSHIIHFLRNDERV